MTRAKISQYSATANDNTDVNGINIAEGCPPSSMNNMGREIMAALKRFQVGSDGDGVTVGGNLIVSGTVTAANTATLGNVTSAAFAAGSAGSPTIHAAGDTNTGIFFPAADTIAFAEGGAEAMRIDSSGNLLVGTTSSSGGKIGVQVSPASAGLTITDGTTSDFSITPGVSSGVCRVGPGTGAMAFYTANAERMRIDSSGNVQVPLTKFVDGSNEQYFVSYIQNFGGAVNCSHKTGYLGTTGDPETGYVILCKAYVSTDKAKDMAFGRIYRMRGSAAQGIVNAVYEFMVGSAYQSNTGSGFYSGTNQTGTIVTVDFGGAKYIALKMGSTSASDVVADVWYGGASGTPTVPALVSAASISNESTITAMTYL